MEETRSLPHLPQISQSQKGSSKTRNPALLSASKSSSVLQLPSIPSATSTSHEVKSLNVKIRKQKKLVKVHKLKPLPQPGSSDKHVEGKSTKKKYSSPQKPAEKYSIPYDSAMTETEVKDTQMLWLKIIMMTSRAMFLSRFRGPQAEEYLQAIAIARKRFRENLRLITFMKYRCRWFRRRIRKRFELLKKHGWRFLLFLRCLRRKKATRLLRTFFMDFAHFRLPYIMLRYRTNAVRVQRYIRSYIEVTKARLEVLAMKWAEIEEELRVTLVPVLIARAQRIERMRMKDKKANGAWKNVRLESNLFPKLANRVNRATKMTAQLQEILSKGEELHERYPEPDDLHDASPHDTNSRNQHKSPKLKKKKKKLPKVPFKALRDGSTAISNHKLREKMIKTFLVDTRILYKQSENEKYMMHQHKKASGLSVDEAKKIMFSTARLQEFAEELSSQEVAMLIYSGTAGYMFRQMVENEVRKEYGFEPKYVPDDDSYYS